MFIDIVEAIVELITDRCRYHKRCKGYMEEAHCYGDFGRCGIYKCWNERPEQHKEK